MATRPMLNGGEAAVCNNAREYVLDRLEGAEEPLSPSELADEYGCSKSHMHNVLSELNSEGEVERPADGHYILAGEVAMGPPPGSDVDDVSLVETAGVSSSDSAEAVGDDTEALGGDDTEAEGGDSNSEESGGQGPVGDDSVTSAADESPDSVDADDSGSGSPSAAEAGMAAAAGGTAAAAKAVQSEEVNVDLGTIAKVVGVLGVLYLGYRSISSGGDDGSDEDQEQIVESEQTQMAGGLAQGGA